MTVNGKVDENYGEFGADGGWILFTIHQWASHGLNELPPRTDGTVETASLHIITMWQHPAKREMGKIEGLTFDFASWLVVCNIITDQVADRQSPPPQDCHNAKHTKPLYQAQYHNAAMLSTMPQSHNAKHSSTQIHTMPHTSRVCTIVHQSVLFNVPANNMRYYMNSVH